MSASSPQAVVDQHEQEHDAEADNAGPHAALDGILAEARPDRAHRLDLERNGQRAILELDGKLLHFLQRKVAADLPLSIGDSAHDVGEEMTSLSSEMAR